MSNKFEKYLKLLISNDKVYYIVTGTDLSDKEEKDFILCDDKKILLFLSILDIKQYVKNNETHDNHNMKRWVEDLEKEEITVEINFDNIIISLEQSKDFSELSNEAINGIFEFLCILKDYLYEYKREVVMEILNDVDTDKFWEHYYDSNIWKNEDIIVDKKNNSINIGNLKLNIKKYFDMFFGETQIYRQM